MNPITDSALHRVLVADDNQANRQLLRAYLSRLGMEAVTAANGVEALEVFERELPDIVLMDVMMPVMDGLIATRNLRERYPDRWIPVVMLSALGTESDVMSGIDNGADDYLVKPISFTVFAAKMRTISRALAVQREGEITSGKLHTISASMSDGLVTFDAGGRILSANPAFCGLVGSKEESMRGKAFSAFFEPDAFMQLSAELAQRQTNGRGAQPVSREMPLCTHGQAARLIRLTVSPLRAGTTDAGYLAMVQDVSGSAQIEAALASYTEELRRYHEEAERESALAQEIIERGVSSHGLTDPAIEYRLSPARRFSGDLVLAARSPSGRLFALLADATGHGLAAAVSVLPAVSEFYRQVALSPTPEEFVSSLSRTLHGVLPIGRFVAAALVALEQGQASVWVGGIPDVFHLDVTGRVVNRLCSHDLPLGVEPLAIADVHCQQTVLAPGEQILVFSDGLLEALSPAGTEFGYEGIAEVLVTTVREGRLAALERAVADHCAGVSPHDDISMLLVSA